MVVQAPDILAVNYHLWQACNMHCRFCFATFQDVRRDVLPAGHLARADALALVDALAAAGFVKITFAGGEPLLCPWLIELVARAKARGLTTCIVSNGSLLTEPALDALKECLDLLTLSIDSIDPATLRATGRSTRGRPLGADELCELIARVRARGVTLRVNTVVTRANLSEDLGRFVAEMSPQRWKIMQVLPIEGQNSRTVGELLISEAEFDAFVARNSVLAEGIRVVVESNADMTGSYAMVDPAGRFFDNVAGGYTYSEPILSVGAARAMAQVRMDHERFVARGGEESLYG